MSVWDHDGLAEDLAASLVAPRRMIWTNLQLGPAGSPRPDVYTLEKSFVNPYPRAYEVKISREDFRADVTAAKWTSYLDYAYSVTFAAPAGLLNRDEIPPMCGLIQRHENCWRLARKATPVPKAIAQEALIKLLIDGVEREGPRVRATHWHQGDFTRRFADRFGAAAARYVGDAASIHEALRRAEESRAKILGAAEKEAAEIRKRAEQDAPALWRELLSTLGFEPESGTRAVRAAIQRLRVQREGTDEALALTRVVNQLRGMVASYEHLCGKNSLRFTNETGQVA